jgi:general secretion pathway protein I
MRASRGFTLIEVAIALAIVGIGVTTVLQLFSGGLRMEAGASTRAKAVIYARGLLDDVMARSEMVPGADQGRFNDGYHYERRVRLAPEATDQTSDLDVQSEIAMYEIEVTVLWPRDETREGTYTLRTLRVGQRPPQ